MTTRHLTRRPEADEGLTVQQLGVGASLVSISEGSNQRDSAAESLFILMMMSSQHGRPHLLLKLRLQVTRC